MRAGPLRFAGFTDDGTGPLPHPASYQAS